MPAVSTKRLSCYPHCEYWKPLPDRTSEEQTVDTIEAELLLRPRGDLDGEVWKPKRVETIAAMLKEVPGG